MEVNSLRQDARWSTQEGARSVYIGTPRHALKRNRCGALRRSTFREEGAQFAFRILVGLGHRERQRLRQ